jgi:hypothetical protein
MPDGKLAGNGRKWAGVKAAEIPQVWPHVFGMIAGACGRSNGRHTTQSIYQTLLGGTRQLWLVHHEDKIEACFVTEIVIYPLTKRCHIVIGTGRGRGNWQHLANMLEGWAKEQGCDGMESIARKGWARVFGRWGWSMTHVFLEKQWNQKG